MKIWLAFEDLGGHEEQVSYLAETTYSEYQLQEEVDNMSVKIPRKSLEERAEFVLGELEKKGMVNFPKNTMRYPQMTYILYV